MTGKASERQERVAAISLLLISMTCVAWTQNEAMQVTSASRAREQQLEHLRTLSQPIGRRADEQSSLAALSGLFRGHDVVWLATTTGPVLTVTPRAESSSAL